MIQDVRIVLSGLGHVNRNLLQILVDKQELIANTYGINFLVVGVADSSGIAELPAGFNKKELLSLRNAGRKVKDLEGYIKGSSTEQLIDKVTADMLVEATPLNLTTGMPGLSCIKKALSRGWKVVTANKGPLVIAFDELMMLKEKHNAGLACSATVCGGLPVINVLTRDLKTAQLKSLQGILNATSNFVLHELSIGNSMEEAVLEAQRIGAAETDPSQDLNGQDTANKLFILMKTFAGFKGTVHDIKMEGIEQIDQKIIMQAKQHNQVIKLVATAVMENGEWSLVVGPKRIPAHSFLGSCNGWEMGIEVKTDLYESISMKNYEADPLGTAAAVLRDMIDLVKNSQP